MSLDLLCLSDFEGRFRRLNPTWESLLGYSREELMDQPILRFVHPDDVARTQLEASRLTGTLGETIEFENRYRARDGSYRWLLWRASADAAQKLVYAVAKDITERKHAEAQADRLATAARSSQDAIVGFQETQYRQIVETTNEGIIMVDAENNITFANQRMAAMLRYSVEEILGRPIQSFMDDDARKIASAKVESRKRGVSELYEFKFCRRDGAPVWALVSASPVLADDGGYGGALAMVTDISERRAAESALRASQYQMQAILDQTRSVIFVKDRDHRYLLVSRAFERLFGAGPGELAGKHDHDIRPPEAVAKYRDADRAVLENGEGVSFEDVLMIEGEARTFLTVKFPLRDELGEIYAVCGISTDITERKLVEDALRTVNVALEERVGIRTAELEAANAQLEAFSYSVSHDLRAPLRTISGFSALLESRAGPALDDEGRRYLKLINKGARDMGMLIDDLLAFARMGRQALNVRLIDPERVVRDSLRDLQGEATEDALGSVCVSSMPPCLADPALLRHVFGNLLSNALKFTRGQRLPRIEVGFAQAAAAGEPPRPGAYFVRDNGVGFDPQYAHKLFGVFQRLHRAEEYEGTGVGLAIVHRVVTRHGGRVWAESTPGDGAAFYFTLDEDNPTPLNEPSRLAPS